MKFTLRLRFGQSRFVLLKYNLVKLMFWIKILWVLILRHNPYYFYFMRKFGSVKHLSEVHSEPCQTYRIEGFARIVNG